MIIMPLVFALSSAVITKPSGCFDLPETQRGACQMEISRGRPYSADVDSVAVPGEATKRTKSLSESSLESMASSLRTMALVSVVTTILSLGLMIAAFAK